MPDPDGDKIEKLKKKINDLEEDIDNKTSGKNRIEVKAYDLSVTIDSEEASISELREVASDEMETLQKRALVGEYQQLEEENMFNQIFGGD